MDRIYQCGALNPESDAGYNAAAKLYDAFRHRETDYKNVARNTGLSLEQCKIVKDYIFSNKHMLDEGYEQFFPDLTMAHSWQRLSESEGYYIKDADLLLLDHELLEIRLLLTYRGLTVREAHNMAESVFDYSRAIRSMYGLRPISAPKKVYKELQGIQRQTSMQMVYKLREKRKAEEALKKSNKRRK